MTAPSIRVQSILFNPPTGSVARYLRGLRQATSYLESVEEPIEVDVRFGDCSPEPSLSEAFLEASRLELLEAGVHTFEYEFFAENLGHGGAQNRLLESRASADLVLILNPDTCLSPRALAELVVAMREPSVGIVEARQLPLEHQKAYERRTGDTSWASGACSLVRGALFDAIGLYDSATFFMYCDDVDLSWRARLAGFRVVHQPSAVVFHDKQLSSAGAYLPSETELSDAALASLMVAAKYSRPDIVDRQLGDFSRSALSVHHAVIEEYRARERDGRLPAPLDPEHTVGQFQTYAYADSRFELRV